MSHFRLLPGRARIGVAALAVAVVVALSLAGTGRAQTVTGNAEAGKKKAEACAACHGPGGNSTNPAVPSLAGQVPLYTYYQLIQFRDRRRVDPQMTPFAQNLSDDDMRDLAVYFAGERTAPGPATVDPAKAEAGWRVSNRLYCESCHRPKFMGQNQVPRLGGLSYDYLVRQLQGYKAQTRADIDLSMTMAAQPLSAEDIEHLAHYITGLARIP